VYVKDEVLAKFHSRNFIALRWPPWFSERHEKGAREIRRQELNTELMASEGSLLSFNRKCVCVLACVHLPVLVCAYAGGVFAGLCAKFLSTSV